MGLVSAAVLAILTQRQFRVCWKEPFPLRRVWRPVWESLPWDLEDYCDRSFATLSLVDRAQAARQWLATADLTRELPDNIVVEANQHFFSYLLANRSLKHRHDSGDDAAHITTELLRRLFQPTAELTAHLVRWMELLAVDRSIGLQIRTLWNFGDGGGGLSADDLERLWDCVNDLVRQEQADRIFVTADDVSIIDRTRRRLHGIDVYSVDGPILHLDRSISTDAWPFLQTFISLHALAACRHLVISHWSNFGRLAAFFANREPWVTRKENGGCLYPQVIDDYRRASLIELISKDDNIMPTSALS